MGRVMGAWKSEDPFNWKRRRTASNTDEMDYNCGGYALRTFSWYCPNSCSLIDKIEELLGEGFDFSEIKDIMTEWMVKSMLSDFGDTLSVIDEKEVPKAMKESDREVVAFRFGIECDDEDDWFDSISKGYTPDYETLATDFHFCVFRDGEWMEKCGDSVIQKVFNKNITSPWNGYILYDGPIVFLEHVLDKKI